MSASDLLFKTIHPLPEVAKLQLLEYVEYLRFKFGMEEDQAEKTEYDQLLLQLLEQRLQQARDAPNSLLSPEAFQQRITQKHNWDEPELKCRFQEDFTLEMEDAIDWYEEKSLGLGKKGVAPIFGGAFPRTDPSYHFSNSTCASA